MSAESEIFFFEKLRQLFFSLLCSKGKSLVVSKFRVESYLSDFLLRSADLFVCLTGTPNPNVMRKFEKKIVLFSPSFFLAFSEMSHESYSHFLSPPSLPLLSLAKEKKL